MTVRSPIDVSPPHRPAREYRVYPALIERCSSLEPLATAIAHPCDESSLQAAIEAAEARLIRPILVGPEAKIRAVAERCGIDLAPYQVVEAAHSHAAAAQAVAIVRAGEAQALMKGSLHTDELMARGRAQGGGPAHRAPHQPRLHHGRAHLFQGARGDRCRDQHLPRPSRPRPTSSRTRSTWRTPSAARCPRLQSCPRSRRYA